MIARRRFLRLLGLGTASAPLAAKSVEAEMMSLTSLRGHGVSPLAPGVVGFGAPSSMDEDGVNPQLRMADYLELWGKLPRHVERQVRENANYVQALDPDLAAKRSWSLSVKIADQRQRNYNGLIGNYKKNGDYERAQVAFKKLVGFRWPW